MRQGESEGNPYYFLEKQDFENKIKEHQLIEWKYVHGNNYYGMGKDKLEQFLEQSKNVITDVEVLGAVDIIDQFPNHCVSIFIDAGSTDELVNRIKIRGSWTEEEIKKRLERTDFEMQYKYHFDYYIYNKDIEASSQDLCNIIQFEISRNQYRIQQPPSSILHYIVKPLIFNSSHQIMLTKQKCPFPTSDWKILGGHVLKNESPKDALLRILHLICPPVSQESKDLIYTLTPIAEQKHFLETHYHYEMVFKLSMDFPPIQSENFDFTWVSTAEVKKYLDEEDVQILDGSI